MSRATAAPDPPRAKAPSSPGPGRWVYFFGDGHAEGNARMRDLLGGKGAGIAEMVNAGIPVPPGYTITTEACRQFFEAGGRLLDSIVEEEERALSRLEKFLGRRLGDASNPLLVSVRSGAPVSMPGMMDTVLNLGLNDETVEGLARRTRNPRFAYDSYRRFIQMFSDVVLGVPRELLEAELTLAKKRARVQDDTGLDEKTLRGLVKRMKDRVRSETRSGFPQDSREQLARARDAVFRSWHTERAVHYRRLNGIPEHLGTAVTVQAMVFGNLGMESATGVGFTRDPATGAPRFYGEYLRNAQGEDVVAGIRTPRPIEEMEAELPAAYASLREITTRLERHYRDVQDFEFTIEEGRLFMLQTRRAARTGPAALRIAVEMVEEGLLTTREAIERVEPEHLDQVLHPVLDPTERKKHPVLARGLPASPGAAAGAIVFTSEEAVRRGATERVILVRAETSPDDIAGMSSARGILTATGGMTSHAAVVARGMGKCCVAGCTALSIDEEKKILRVAGRALHEGAFLSLDGSTGEVLLGDAPTADSEVVRVLTGRLKPDRAPLYQCFEKLTKWCDEVRRLRVRANADVPADARLARHLGAEGIGLCRTEHMFFAEERIPHVVTMILNAQEAREAKLTIERLEEELENSSRSERVELTRQLSEAKRRGREPIQAFEGALKKLLPLQRADFKGLFLAMEGLPVTIRTLDPPLHEFLPKREQLLRELGALKRGDSSKARRARLEATLARVEELHEFNPMLGFRGCRLGILHPEITRMQARAIFEAAAQVLAAGKKVAPEIMIPLVGGPEELARQREVVESVAVEVMRRLEVRIPYTVGTMIEVPRAAVLAGEIAAHADFFSFGTNDLTQMTFGYSRDDSGRFLPEYVRSGILATDPFVSIDVPGVGALVRRATFAGRKAKPGLKIGVCGEHGGDGASIELFEDVGLDYVSCSPFRVPLARLAAARAALRRK
ncbi:MAG TPA: pyruvate, phosphate dikinase [Candidatus Polarisedimenticolia bacterium]|nr:pyruvate, phosphate dikinase [Candidatus Polarisedimenticolia bacterium]